MARRGFTLLEVLLSTVLGSLVVLAGLSVMATLARVDRTLGIRSRATTEMATTHVILQKMFRATVLSNVDQTPGAAPEEGDEQVEQPEEVSPARFAQELRTRQDMTLVPAHWLRGIDDDRAWATNADGERVALPRIIIRPDVSPSLVRAAADLGFTGVMQSLEIVTSEPPGGMRWPSLLTPEEAEVMRSRIIASRGLLEVRPEPEDDGVSWSLWWRPLMPDGRPFPGDGEYGDENYGLKLVSGLREYRWQVFYRGQWLEQFHATNGVDIPAYIQLRIATTSGMEATWLFEVGGTPGPEAVDPAASEIIPFNSANRDFGDAAQEPEESQPGTTQQPGAQQPGAQQPGGRQPGGQTPQRQPAGRTPGRQT